MRRLTRREQKIFGLCLFMIVIYISYNVVFKPIRERTLLLENQITKNLRQLRKERKLLEKSSDIGTEYQSFLDEFKQTKSNEQVMSSMISEIEKVAEDLDLRISDLKPKRVKEAPLYNRFSVSLTIDSPFSEIIHFLYQVQNEPHIFNIEELRFDKGAQRKSSNVKTRLVLSKILIP